MNYDADRAMSQKRLRMEGEGGHGVVQGNGLPLNYMDNGHQIAYGAYPGAYNTHYPPPEFSAYGPPPPGGYAPQNLSYAPPAHQNYPPHHQSFPPQQPQQLHMGQTHMGYGIEHSSHPVHKPGWPQHILAGAHDQHKPLEVKPKAEVKLEPTEAQKRPHSQERDSVNKQGDAEQPKIKIKTDIFKPEELQQQQQQQISQQQPPQQPLQPPIQSQQTTSEKSLQDASPVTSSLEPAISAEVPKKDEVSSELKADDKSAETQISDINKPDGPTNQSEKLIPDGTKTDVTPPKEEVKSPSSINSTSPTKTPVTPAGLEPKKRGRPKGSTNKPRGVMPPGPRPQAPGRPPGIPPSPRAVMGRPRGASFYNAVRPFRKDFSGIQFRRRWSDDGLDSSHIPNEVFFGDVPVSMEVLFNYYDANIEKEKMQALKQQQAKLVAAKLQARGIIQTEVTTVDSSSEDTSSGSEDSDSSESEEESTPQKPKKSVTSSSTTPARRGRPPVPPELRGPGIMEMKRFCKAAGIRFDYKKLTEGCTKNKERVEKMMDLLVKAGLEGKPTLEKCQALKVSKQKEKTKKKEENKRKKTVKVVKEKDSNAEPVERRMTRGATGTKPRQKIVISSDEEDDSPDARITISKLRQIVKSEK